MDASGRSPIGADEIVAQTVEVSRVGARPDLNFARSVFVYRSLFDELASPQRLGLSEEDLLTAWPADRAVTATYQLVGDQRVDLPLLVPVEHLHWYNADFFRDLYGPTRPVQYYTHVPVELGDTAGGNSALGVIAAELEEGTVIITDSYATDDMTNELDDWSSFLRRRGATDLCVDTVSGNDAEGVLNQFVANVDFSGERQFAERHSFRDHFLEAQKRGRARASADGIEVVESVADSEAERLWAIYEGPFDALSGGHPLRAGFDRRVFMDAMTDPGVVKVLRRGDGDITTLCLFVMDLRQCPWLNADFYEEHHRDAFHTRNILVFTGVVSDERMQGSSYASALVTALTEIAGLRETSHLVTFECNSVSSLYIPRIVSSAITRAAGASVSGLDAPVSRLAFKAISKAT
ncbi:MAG: hypothetical protein ACRDY4_10640 [Acidimicrobiia bacterium]